MKRSSLTRRTPLKRTSGLKKTPFKAKKNIPASLPKWQQLTNERSSGNGNIPDRGLRSSQGLKSRSTKRAKEESQLKVFMEIWEERDHVSYISGRDIPFFSLSNFAHVLNKKDYPKFRTYKKNIPLLHPEEHTLFDQGTIAKREEYAKKNPTCDWGRLDLLKWILLDEYRL